jgi:GMP synthase-like glutamine amidotransferase
VPSPVKVARYHSLVAEADALPQELRPTAWTGDGVLMAFEHNSRPIYGVQFHPESILTECGYELLANFLRLAGLNVSSDQGELAESEIRAAAVAGQQLPVGPVTF